MAHTIHTGTKGEQARYFQRLWGSLLDPDEGLTDRIERLLDSEAEAFGMEYGFLSRIDREAGEQTLDIVHGPGGKLESEMTIPLSQTYCRKTIASETGTMAVSDAPTEGWTEDPAYERFELDSYVGTTVTVDGELYGTLCFVSNDAQETPFGDDETALLEMHAQWVSYELSRRAPRDTEWGDLDDDRLDTMLDALRERTRRRLLLGLLDDATADPVDLLDAGPDHQHVRVQLRHRHLPKLERAGYVDWNREHDTVARGQNFEEVAPLLRLWSESRARLVDGSHAG